MAAKQGTTPLNIAEWHTKCPACTSSPLEKSITTGFLGLSMKESYKCPACGSTFTQSGYRFQFTSIPDLNNPVWKQYGNQEHTGEEWKKIAQESGALVKQRQRDIEYYLDNLQKGTMPMQFVGADQLPIMLKKGETVAVGIPEVALYEPRVVTTSFGGFAGPSFRVGKGMSIRSGMFASRSQSHEEVQLIDQGLLVVTSKRMVFMGRKHNNTMDLTKIISIEPYPTGIALRRDGKQKTEYYYGLDHVTMTLKINNREYEELLTGPLLLCMIQGLLNKM